MKGRKERSGLFIQKENSERLEWNGFVEAIKVKGGILLFLDKENNFST